MSQATISQTTVMDLVPFGTPESSTGFYALRLTPPDWQECRAGQFVMLRPVDCGLDMLWARPFSICRKTERDLILFFQVKGRATSDMKKLGPGAVLNIWGPLGNSFAAEAKTPTLILAGGIGIAPFVGYVQTHPTPWDITMEFGHRMPLNCYPFDSINEKVLADTHLEKNDKDRENFMALMETRITQLGPNGLVLACGPTPFLKTVQHLSARHKVRAQLSLETRMACGIGACLGCVVKANGEKLCGRADNAASANPASLPPAEFRHVQTCTCGPVFWADSVEL